MTAADAKDTPLVTLRFVIAVGLLTDLALQVVPEVGGDGWRLLADRRRLGRRRQRVLAAPAPAPAPAAAACSWPVPGVRPRPAAWTVESSEFVIHGVRLAAGHRGGRHARLLGGHDVTQYAIDGRHLVTREVWSANETDKEL